jgi:NAD(P)-dependent dehydrogenase (short-subunit alcohol dehydrogenase family)
MFCGLSSTAVGEFDGRAVIVTGGALGIGRGIAQAFAAAGAMVAIADINRGAADKLSAELVGAGALATAVIGDVSKANDAERIVRATVDRFGRLDVLVNNAGILPIDNYFRVEDTPEEVWDRILDVNLKGVFLMSKYAIPRLREAGGGVIVNMSSVQGLQSMPRVPSYAASKGGILSLTRNMALDYAREGIRVVAICPGTIDSELVRTLARAEGGDEDANVRRYGSFHPIGRIGTPADIANAVLFLASDRASFITGEYLTVDGGFMAQGAWASSAGGES